DARHSTAVNANLLSTCPTLYRGNAMNNNIPPSLETEPPEAPLTQRKLARRTTLVNGIGVLFILGLAAVVLAADALLLIFACILFAILLYKLSELMHRRFQLRRQLALGIVVLLLSAVIGLGSWAMAPQISEQ